MTVTLQAAERTLVFGPLASREDCLKFMGTLRTSERLRGRAGSPESVADVAASSGAAEELVRAKMLALADGIDELTGEGLTPLDCCVELGWIPEFVAELLGVQLGGAE